MLFFITSYDERLSLGKDLFVDDKDVNWDGNVVKREPLIRVYMITVEFRWQHMKKYKV